MLCIAADFSLIEHMRAIFAGVAARQETEDTRNSAVRCLGIAAVRGNIDVVDEILEAFGSDFLFATPFNIEEVMDLRGERAPWHPLAHEGTCTALTYLVAARNASPEVARRLLGQGGRRLLEMCDRHIGSPLSIALRDPANVDMVDLLLDAYETMPDALGDGYVCQALWTAVQFDWDYAHIAHVLEFVGPHFILNTAFVEGDLLFHVIEHGRVDVFRLFLEVGLDLRACIPGCLMLKRVLGDLSLVLAKFLQNIDCTPNVMLVGLDAARGLTQSVCEIRLLGICLPRSAISHGMTCIRKGSCMVQLPGASTR